MPNGIGCILRIMYIGRASMCLVVVKVPQILPIPPELHHWHLGNHMIACNVVEDILKDMC